MSLLCSQGDCFWLTTALSPRLGGAVRDENPLLQPDFAKAALGDEDVLCQVPIRVIGVRLYQRPQVLLA